MNFLNKIFGSKSQKKLKKITPLVSSINNLEDGYSLLSDEELKKYTDNLFYISGTMMNRGQITCYW